MSPDAVSITIGPAIAQGLSSAQLAAFMVTFLLGIFNLAWTFYLSRLTRRRSVDDEFWFRKVIAPLLIDGLIEFSGIWISKLSGSPSRRGDKKSTRALVKECKEEAEKLLTRCLCLKLYSSSSYKEATSRIDAIVDVVTERLYAVSSSAISSADAQEVANRGTKEIGVILVEFLAGLKRLQSGV